MGMGPIHRRRLVISFSGIDGSGKTTQVQLLRNRLEQNGVETVTVWSRWHPLLSLPLLQILRLTGQLRVYRKDFLSVVEFQDHKNESVASLWCFATQLENFLKTSLKLSLPLALGRTVICDRYTLDLLVDGISDLDDSPKKMRLGFKLLSLLPRPDRAFLIDTDAEIAFGRKPDLPSVSHNVKRVGLFRSLCRSAGVRLMDGRRSPDAIHQDVWSSVSGMISSQ